MNQPLTDRLLMGPGPSNPYPEVAEALARPMLGHLDPEFLTLLDETNARLQRVWQTQNRLTFPLSATGSAGMEASFVNFVGPGDVVVVGVNGVFGGRMCEVARRCGAEVIAVDIPWGQPVPADSLLAAHPSPAAIAVVHAETSTGVRSDLAELGANKGDALLVADCVTSLGGIDVNIDDWGVDVAYSGTQKCLGVPPGLAPLTVSDRALERLIPTPQSWYLDLNLIAAYVNGDGGRAYHHTAPISMIAALWAALGAIEAEGLEQVWARHEAVGQQLHAGLQERGFKLWAAEGYRLPELTTVEIPVDRLPAGMDEAAVRARLLTHYGIEVGGGLGAVAGKIWRIGAMGHTARPRNVAALLGALDEILN